MLSGRAAALLLAAGVGVGTAAAAIAFASDAPAAHAVLLATELAAGREASIPAGAAAGLPPFDAGFAALLIEWTMLLLLAPVLLLAGDAIHDWRPVRHAAKRAEAFAARRPGVGVLSLGALTLVPFLPVGALTSVLLGRILRLPPAKLIPILMLAELLACASIAWAVHVAAPFVHPAVVAGAMLGLVLVGLLVERLRARRATA